MNFVKRPSRSSYDYIVVGSGSAGSVLAARLAADDRTSVLLLESGPSDRSIFIQMPAALGIPLLKDRYNWKFFSESEEYGAEKRRIYEPRGRVFGGSSAVNGMNWVRGNRADYDVWAEAGLSDWSYAHCLPYFKRAETYEGGGDEYRGTNGPTRVRRAQIDNPLFAAFLQATEQVGYVFNEDHNGAEQIGSHKTQRNVANGIRHSASQAYIYDQPDRPLLEILLETSCTSVEFSNHQAVRIVATRHGERFSIEIGKEAIICAGAIQSPQLLMLSGLGNGDMLRGLGIPVVQHMPGVGENLQDHVAWCFDHAATNPTDSLSDKLSTIGRLKIGLEWLLTRRGLGASNHFEVGAFFCANEDETVPDSQLECIAMRGDFGPDGVTVNPGYQSFLGLQRPTSRGRLWIDSANPKNHPRFVFRYLSTDYDKRTAIAAIRATQNIYRQSAWSGKLGPEQTGNDDLRTDEEILAWAVQHAESNYHPCGTCRMGNDDDAVTDTEGRVHGIRNLRVVDASIIPSIPTANLNAPVIMLAEKLSDRILGAAAPLT